MRKIVLCLLVGMFAIACSKKGGGKATSLNIAKLGLKADVPEGTTAGKAIMGEGVMLQGPDLVVEIEEAGAQKPKTVEEAQKEADMYSPKNVIKEKLPDGWALAFENKGGMGTNYFVQVRREIGGKAYWCSTTASSPEQKQNALNACKSLKK